MLIILSPSNLLLLFFLFQKILSWCKQSHPNQKPKNYPRILLHLHVSNRTNVQGFYVLLTPLNISWLYLYLPLHVNCLCLNFCPPLIKTFKIHIIYYGLRAPCLILPFYLYNFTFFYYFLLSLPSRHKALLFVSWIPDLISILEPLHLAVHSAWRTNSFPRPFTQRYIQLLSIILLC